MIGYQSFASFHLCVIRTPSSVKVISAESDSAWTLASKDIFSGEVEGEEGGENTH